MRGPLLLRAAVCAAALALGTPAAPAAAGADALPFRSGERLAFQIRWLGVPVGRTQVAVEGPLAWEDHRVFRFRGRLKSTGIVRRLYPVEDRAESHADAAGLFSHRIDVHQKEGRYRNHKWYAFRGRKVTYGQSRKPPREFESPGRVQDFLSLIYKVRALRIGPGESAEIPVFERRKNWQVLVRATRTETVDSLWGPVPTLLLEPQIRSAEKKEDYPKESWVWIWITRDAHRVPVRLESRTALGPVVIHLVEAGGVPSGPLSGPPIRKLSRWKPATRIVGPGRGSVVQKLREFLKKNK